MCVIAILRKARLTEDQVSLMYDSNDSGGGAAWRELGDNNEPAVRWSKGNSKEEMVELNKTLPFPYVLHFRVPSGGTSKSLLACHPFVIDDDATCHYEGITKNFVLFHNGFWRDWEDKLQNISISGFVKIPPGPWSDSRGLALAANHLGRGFLSLTKERIAALGPGDLDLEAYGNWETIENPDDNGELQKILVSNKIWDKTPYIPKSVTPPIQISDRRRIAPSEQPGGADAKAGTFPFAGCHTPSPIRDGGDRQETVQPTNKGAGDPVPEGNSFALVSVIKKQCNGCPKITASGTVFNDRWYCFHCWSDRTQQHRKSIEPLVGKCYICTHSYGASKLQSNDKWICRTCWETNDKPAAYFVVGKTTGRAAAETLND